MDSNDKNNFRVDPLPPYLSVELMICPCVHTNSVHVSSVRLASVHVTCAGNVNDRLNRGLESRAWLE